MAWQTPDQRSTGDVITVAQWNNFVYWCLRYLKGLDGIVTIDSDATIGGVGIGWHDSAATGTHGATGGNYLALSDGSQHITVNRSGDSSLGQDFKREGTANELRIYGGNSGYPGRFDLYGGSHGSYPGAIRMIVQNAAGSSHVEALRISKGDNPPITGSGRIRNELIKTGTSSTTIIGKEYDDVITNVTMHDYCFYPSFWCDGYQWYTYILPYYAGSDPGNTTARIRVRLKYNVDPITAIIRWRHCTASGPPEIWVGFDEKEGITAVWESDDPAAISPPISSQKIKMLAKIQPEMETFNFMRSLSRNIGLKIIKEGEIKSGKLIVNSIDFPETPIEIKPAESFPRIERREMIRYIISKEKVNRMRKVDYFDENIGWTTRDEPWYLPAKVTRYRLANPELGKLSEVEEYMTTELQPVWEDVAFCTSEKYIEEREI
jgi:hypothetical protein